MADKSDLLAQTKPLADPLRVITTITIVLGVFIGLVTWPASGLWAGLGMTCSFLSFAWLIAPDGKPNAIYLRAFRTDKSTAELRAELAAILGPEFRLSGIRPPREKSSVFVRFLMPGVVAMRYSGSKFMELEAGDDWMARLWKTYQTTRLVLIDVREVTPYVHQEIEMTLQSVGASRCIFVVNHDKTGSEWLQILSEIVGPENDQAQLQLLDVSPERVASCQIGPDLDEILKRLPPGVPGELKSGRQFILDHVSEDLIRKSRRPSAMTVFSAAAALFLAAVFGVLWNYIPHSPLLVLFLSVAVLVPSLALIFGNISQAVSRAGRLRRAGHPAAAHHVWLVLLGVFLLFLAGPILNAVQYKEGGDSNAPLSRVKKAAQEISAMASLRALSQAELLYDASSPSGGYACSLTALGGNPGAGPPTLDSAQLIPPDLASGVKAGYTFAIARCTNSVAKGQEPSFQITAVPVTVGRTGDRGFCIDEGMQIRFDPKGGTNCTEQMQ